MYLIFLPFMFYFYELNRGNKLFRVSNSKKTAQTSTFLLESFVKKFTPKDSSLQIKSVKILTQKFFFLSKNCPLLLKKNKTQTKVEMKNVKTFYVFSNFTKLQFTYYFFEKILFEALTKLLTFSKENLPSKMLQNNLEEFNKQSLSLFSFCKFLKLEKPFDYNIESFVTFSYLNIFLKERKLDSISSLRTKKKNSLFKSFLMKNMFDFSSTILLFTFETIKKKSELFIQSTDLRKKKTYWLSLVKIFEDSLFQCFRKITSIFSILTMEKIHLSLKTREETLTSSFFSGPLPLGATESRSCFTQDESYQRKKLTFYLYKSHLYSVLNYFSYPLNSAFYRFSDSNLIHLKEINRSFQFLSDSEFDTEKKEKNERFLDFIILFFGVHSSDLASRFDQFLLTKIFKHLSLENLRNNSLTFFSQNVFSESNPESLFYLFKTSHSSEKNVRFFDFGKIQPFLFDKLKKHDLNKKLINIYNIQQTKNSLSSSFLGLKKFRFRKKTSFIQNLFYPNLKFLRSSFLQPHSFSLKLKKQIKFCSLLNSDFTDLWSLTKPRPTLELSFLNSFQNWIKKNHLRCFKIQLFPTVISFQFLLSESIYVKNGETFNLFYYKTQSFMIQNHKISSLFYWNYNPFGFLTILPYQLNVHDYLDNLKRVIKQNSSTTQTILINKLNSKILSYCYHNYFILNQRTFKQLDKELVKLLWKWSLRRHNNKSNQWIQNKYFFNLNRTTWIFGSNSSLFSMPLKEDFEKSNVQLIYLPYHHQIFKIFSLSFSS